MCAFSQEVWKIYTQFNAYGTEMEIEMRQDSIRKLYSAGRILPFCVTAVLLCLSFRLLRQKVQTVGARHNLKSSLKAVGITSFEAAQVHCSSKHRCKVEVYRK